MQRIVLVGFAGSGKNTVGDYLVEHHGYVGLSFADALKDTLASVFCWDRAALEGITGESRQWRETVDPWWAAKLGIPEFTPRYAMQRVGTDLFRRHFNPDVWINNVERRILDLGDRKIVVMDGRFPNEINLVTNKLDGTSIRVKRGPEPDWWDLALRANDTSRHMSIEVLREVIEKKPSVAQQLKTLNVHPSEYSWIGHPIDITLDNDTTVEDLKAKVDALIR